jgi:hypothetical protein
MRTMNAVDAETPKTFANEEITKAGITFIE